MAFFLNAKHWQLFLLFLGLMIIPQFILPSIPFKLGFTLIMLAFIVVMFGWLSSIGLSANNRVDKTLQRSPKLMLAGLVYATLYMLLSGVFLIPDPNNGEVPTMGLILPFHLLAMACIFYSLGYTAKRLVTLQAGKEVGFFEYSGPFFGFWFFPIGVWFIQPKVNELLGENA